MSLDRTGEVCGMSMASLLCRAVYCWIRQQSSGRDARETAGSVIITLFLVTPNSDQGKTVGVRDYQMHAPLQLQRPSRAVPGPNTSAAMRSKIILKTSLEKTLKPRDISLPMFWLIRVYQLRFLSTDDVFPLSMCYLGLE